MTECVSRNPTREEIKHKSGAASWNKTRNSCFFLLGGKKKLHSYSSNSIKYLGRWSEKRAYSRGTFILNIYFFFLVPTLEGNRGRNPFLIIRETDIFTDGKKNPVGAICFAMPCRPWKTRDVCATRVSSYFFSSPTCALLNTGSRGAIFHRYSKTRLWWYTAGLCLKIPVSREESTWKNITRSSIADCITSALVWFQRSKNISGMIRVSKKRVGGTRVHAPLCTPIITHARIYSDEKRNFGLLKNWAGWFTQRNYFGENLEKYKSSERVGRCCSRRGIKLPRTRCFQHVARLISPHKLCLLDRKEYTGFHWELFFFFFKERICRSGCKF